MEYHYKAFISYRHAELDTKVAIEIQNRIERYIIPRSIRKELGIKSIGRVFRDKDELPSTSDLNDNIKNAIINSEYLICICSPRYIESIWCQKEIEFFLESHDKHHVLTVLAEGDPYEVVPEILCTETVTVKDENGNDVTIETKLEPLSCDYRGDRHRARNEEFPRLAAVLIGCRYADLRQKMRKRRMRLAAAAGAFAAALAGYFIWSYINIQNNYRRSLINQSQYLASSANEALSTNDNILAAQLSLAALPDKGKDRPVVPEAVYTLSRAIGAYQTKQVMNIRGVASYTPQAGTFSCFAITNDAHYMAMLTTGGDVEVCDLSKNTAPYTLSSYKLFGTAAGKVTDCGVDRFVLYDKNHDDIAMIRFSDGEVLWHQQFKGKDRGVLPLGKDGASLLLLTYDEAIILNSENGEVVSRCSIPAASGGENRSLSVISDSYYRSRTDVCVNEENKSCTILCSSYNKSSAGSVSGALTYYYETGKTVWTPFRLENYYYEGVSQDTEGNILFSYAEKETDYSLNEYYRRAYDSGSAHFDSGLTAMAMVKEGTGEILWQNTVEYQGLRNLYSCFEIRTMPGSDGNPARKVVLAAISNRIALFDAGDGTKIKDISVSDYVVSVDRQDPNESFARVNGASGAQYYFDSSSEGYEGMTFMEGTVDNAYFFHARETFDSVSQYVMRQGNTIRVFKFEQGDDEYKFFGFDVPEGSVIQNYIIGSRLVLRTNDNKLLIYDMENDKKLHEIQLEDDFYYSYLCSAADQSCFYLKSSEDSSGRIILRIDLEKGTCEKVDITHNDFLTGDGKWKFDCSNCIVSGDYLFYRASNYNSMTSYWFRHSLKDGTTAILELPYYEDIDSSSFAAPRCLFARDGSKCVLYFDNALYLADFVSGTVTAIDAEIPGITYSTRRESDGMFAFYYQGSQESDSRKELHVYDAAGKPVWEIDNLPEAITALRFYRDVLIVGTDNNRLYAYDARSGARKGMTELGGKLYHEDLQIYDGTDGDLIFDIGTSVIMVNYENWAQTGAISDIIGYCPDLKWIISSIDYADKYGYCRYYSVDDLVEKGKAFVGEQTMSEADMATYGLN